MKTTVVKGVLTSLSSCSLSYLGGVFDRAVMISCGSDAVTDPVTGWIIIAQLWWIRKCLNRGCTALEMIIVSDKLAHSLCLFAVFGWLILVTVTFRGRWLKSVKMLALCTTREVVSIFSSLHRGIVSHCLRYFPCERDISCRGQEN